MTDPLLALKNTMHAAAQAIDEPAAIEMVLKKIAFLTGSASAYIFAPNRYTPSTQPAHGIAQDYGMQFQFGMPESFFADYQARVWKMDPWSEQFPKHLPKILLQGGFIGTELVSSAHLRSSEFYADYLRPELGMYQMMSTTLSNGHVLSMMRSGQAKTYDTEMLKFTGQFKI
ncbi:MAG: hypothetical protein HC858_02295 [Brachymonas sp.]|nr:hypothetical protein [Brachymonas sp.]